MKNLALLISFSITFTAYGQTKEVLFKSKFNPNSEYTTKMESSSKSEIIFTGPEEKINNIKASGVKLPMIFESSTIMTSTIQTFDLNSTGTFKANLSYDDVQSFQVQNAERTEKDSPLSGMLIKGIYNAQNKFKVDTIISNKVDQNTRNTLISTLENVQEQISFPDYPLKVGDKFEQELPMNIPIAGANNVAIIIKTNFRLNNISADLAEFDINQTIELNMEMDQANVSASGEGTGVAQFDISKTFITKYESDLTITLKMDIEDLKVSSVIHTKSLQNVTIK